MYAQNTPMPEEHSAEVGGLTLHYATWGTWTEPERAVLLVHGLTANSRYFGHVGPVLAAQGWYAIAPDLRGRGLSEKPPYGYSIAIHACDLLALSDHLGLAGVPVIGHSLGAFIGAYMAAQYPDRVRNLVMIDGGGIVPEDVQRTIATTVSRLGTVYPSLDAYLALMRQLPVITWNPFWETYFRYDADVRPDGTVVSRVPRAAIDEENLALALTRTEDIPALIRQPVLVLRATVGTIDRNHGFILPAEEAARLHTVMPQAQVIDVPETNHYTVMLSDVVDRAIVTFLAN